MSSVSKPVFHMLVSSWWILGEKENGDGREERLCKSASRHIQPTQQMFGKNLKITVLRKAFSNIGRAISNF